MQIVDEIDFRNPARAREDLAHLDGVPEGILKRIRILLASVPDPDEALHHLERLRRESPAAFDRLVSSPAALRYLLGTFAHSRFLSEALLRRPEALLQITGAGDMHRVLSAEEFEQLLERFLGEETGPPPALSLARFRRRQILRVMLRDVLGLATLSEITLELSNLADAILELAYRRIRDDLVRRHGHPREDGRGATFAVISLGKLGGQELNYSSDIDLMFLYSANGETDGPSPITNKEFFKKIANQYTELLSTYTSEGLCYRVDLRLRPDGRLGEVCISLDGARAYYAQRARDWEKQMLIKARVSAGDRDLGRALLDFVEPLIYATSLDFRAVESVSETRERISEKLAARRGPAQAGLDVKLAPGGIRDIEFLVQCLQRLHGGREHWVRHGGTLLALSRLRDKDLLSPREYARLASAYQFLRALEHRLQFDEDRQVHALPADSDALAVLARKMPAEGTGQPYTAESLLRTLQEHLRDVRELYERVIYAQKPMYYTPAEPPPEPPEPAVEIAPPPASNLTRFLDDRAPHLAARLAQAHLHRGRERFEHFLEAVLGTERLARLDADPRLAACTVDLFELSPFFADQLLRHPELLDDVLREFGLESEPLDDSVALRRFFGSRMLRIQSASLCGPVEIFSTLERTSDLADHVIQLAYRIALAHSSPRPSQAAYAPSTQMMVVALGRLGMREFDLASDADLVFVLPDSEMPEHLYWTGVAEKVIHILGAYTGEGVMFTVDTRLRPNGRAGPLVQSEGAYKEYFTRHAEAWEGITYMKARGVAGDVERATAFLDELQQVDWRRYGQSRRSRSELAQMRARLEKEQGARNPLKAGAGGFYDIDFALLYLRLKAAGIFYKVLNTPARIDVIEKMGHLEREDADFLRDAATFYRAIDHGLRIANGQASGSLPTSQAQLEVLTELVRRWTPEHLHNRRLDAKLAEIRQGTREFFNRLFGC